MNNPENHAMKSDSNSFVARTFVARTVFGKPQWCSGSEVICTDIFSILREFDSLKNVTQVDKPPKKLCTKSEVDVNASIRAYLTRRRFVSESLGPSYLSINDPDYKPVAFLERALRLSASVCRIIRKICLKDLILLIEEWNSQDVPEMCKALGYFFEIPPEESSWEKYWGKYKDQKFKYIFETRKMKGVATRRNEEFLFVPYATGFLVGKSHVITNFHVLNLDEHERTLDDFRVQFRYVRNLNNRDIRPIEYQLKSILSGDPNLDYTLLEIEKFPEIEIDPSEKISLSEEDIRRSKLRKAKLSFEQAGENFGWLRMNSDQAVIPNISTAQIEEAGNQLKLKSDEEIILEKSKIKGGIQGEPLIIIQHPRGRPKEIVAFNSNILKASESYIQYTTDTDFGSSGSPILNGDLQLIGLHFGALIEYTGSHKEIDNKADSKSQDTKSSISIKANIGTRTSAIVKHLRTVKDSEKAVNLKRNTDDEFTGEFINAPKELGEFIREYIDSQRYRDGQYQYKVPRRIFLLGGLERNISGDVEFTRKLVEEMVEKFDKMKKLGKLTESSAKKYDRVKIINALEDIRLFSGELKDEKSEKQRIAFNKLRILSDPQLPLKMAIAWMNTVCDLGDGDDSRSYRPGDVALQVVTEKYESEELQLKLKQLKRKSLVEQESDPLPRGMLVYHVSDNRERRSHAELILDKLSEGIPTLKSRGALSDFISPEGRHTFCGDLYMPSLVINLGFLEHPLDQQVLGANEEKIFDEDKLKKLAEELVEAVIAWSDALNPGSFSPD